MNSLYMIQTPHTYESQVIFFGWQNRLAGVVVSVLHVNVKHTTLNETMSFSEFKHMLNSPPKTFNGYEF